MSQSNTDIVRALNEAFNRGDDSWLELYDPAAEVHLPPGLFEDPVCSGHFGVRQAAALWTEAVSEYRWVIERLIDAGDCVVGLFYFCSRIGRRGAWLKPPFGAVFYLREGRITRVLTYFSWSEALQTAGVQGPARSHSAA